MTKNIEEDGRGTCIACYSWDVIPLESQFSDEILSIHVCRKKDPPKILCDRGMEGIPDWCPYKTEGII